MKRIKYILLVLLILFNPAVLNGCWNYHDIEKYLIVVGMAIDKNEQGDKYLLTVEAIDFELSGREAKQVSRLIQSEGNTVFDAIRNVVNITGKKLYWAHSDILIISKDIAKEGVIPALDLINRDPEMREEMDCLISKEKTAKEILEQQTMISGSNSSEIELTLNGQEVLGKAPHLAAFKFVGTLEESGISATLPAIIVEKNIKKNTAKLAGTAMFKSDKLVGFLDPEETKYFLFATDKMNRGALTVNKNSENGMDNISLEIFETKTKVNPQYSNRKLSMKIDILAEVAIAEISSPVNYIEESNIDQLKKDAEESLKISVEGLIRKVQNEYGTDIFGFGMLVKAYKPSLWKELEPDWDPIFEKLEVTVNVNMTIRHSALVTKTIQKGD